MRAAFPDVFRSVKTMQVARTVLMHKRRAIDHLKHRGLLEDKEVKRLEDMTADCAKRLMRSTSVFKYRDATQALRDQVPFFGALSETQFREMVSSAMTVKTYARGEAVLAEDAAKSFGVVKSGVVETRDPERKGKDGDVIGASSVGHILGLMNHLVFSRRRRTTYVAASKKVEVYEFPVSVLDGIMAESSEIRTHVWQTVAFFCARLMSRDIFGSWTHPTKLALACAAHNVPMYVVAPTTTFDLGLEDGAMIPIEERDAEEVLALGTHDVAAPGVGARNPAFDITPGGLLAGIVTPRHRRPSRR